MPTDPSDPSAPIDPVDRVELVDRVDLAGLSAALNDLGAQVAANLGPRWRLDTDPKVAALPDARLHGPDGAYLRLAVTSPAPTQVSIQEPARASGRVTVHGCYPAPGPHPPGVTRHAISVRADRGPVLIAREITRRLLPGYLPDLAGVRADLDARHADTRARDRLASEVATRLHGHATAVQAGEWRSSVTFTALHAHGADGIVGGDGRPGSGRAVSGDIHLDGDGSHATVTLRGLRPDTLRALVDLLTSPHVRR